MPLQSARKRTQCVTGHNCTESVPHAVKRRFGYGCAQEIAKKLHENKPVLRSGLVARFPNLKEHKLVRERVVDVRGTSPAFVGQTFPSGTQLFKEHSILVRELKVGRKLHLQSDSQWRQRQVGKMRQDIQARAKYEWVVSNTQPSSYAPQHDSRT